MQISICLLLNLLPCGFELPNGVLAYWILDMRCDIYDIACGKFVHLTTRTCVCGSSSALVQTPFPDCFVLFDSILYMLSNFVLNLYS